MGYGRTGLVIRHYENTLKIPRVYRNLYASLEERDFKEITKEQNDTFLKNEKKKSGYG